MRVCPRGAARIALTLSLAALTSACVSLEWTPSTDQVYGPLPDDTEVEVWLAPPPASLFPFASMLDNPPVGLGPPGAIPLASAKGFVFRQAPWSNRDTRQAGWVISAAEDEARDIGGDVVLIRNFCEGKVWGGNVTIEILRSVP